MKLATYIYWWEGKVTVNVVPLPSLLVKVTVPFSAKSREFNLDGEKSPELQAGDKSQTLLVIRV